MKKEEPKRKQNNGTDRKKTKQTLKLKTNERERERERERDMREQFCNYSGLHFFTIDKTRLTAISL